MNFTESCDDILGFKQEDLAETTPLARTVGYFGLIAVLSACPACWIYFVYNRVTTNAPRLTKRNLTMLTTFTVGMIILSGTVSLNNIVGNENFECRLFSILTLAGFQLILLSFFMRIVAYVNRIKFNKALINTKMKHLALNGYVLQGDLTTKQKLEAEANGGRRNSILSEFVPPGYCQPAKNCIMALFCWTQPPAVPANLQFSLFLSSARYLNAMFLLLNIVFGFLLISTIYRDSYIPSELECFGCAVEQGSGFLVISLGVLLVCALMLFFLRKYPDSLGVKKEIYFFVLIIVFFHTIVIELPVEAIPALKELDEERKFDFTNLFLVLEAIVVLFHQLPYQVFISRRVDDEVTEVKEPMEVFIQDTKRARPFLLYLSHCLATENLLFVKAVEAWKADFDLFTPEKKKQRADNVVAQFIVRDAFNHINISGQMAKGIIERVDKDNLDINMLDEALNEILVLLRPLYKKFHDSAYNKALKGELAEADMDTLELEE